MNPNYYLKQKERALVRKIELINYKGGKCEKCGYDKNIAALEFHHRVPKDKEFQLDSRHLSNTNIDKLKVEVEKCDLLCSNCHRELHNSHYIKENLNQLLDSITSNNVKVLSPKRQQSICPFCGKSFDSMKGKIYCSNECRENSKNYPTKDEVLERYKTLESWEKVAQSFGLTRKIVNRIRKS